MKHYWKICASVVLFATIFYCSVFVVRENETVMILQFGEPKRIVLDAGLNMKVPFIQENVVFDRRITQVDTQAKEVLSLDQKRLIVDAYTQYRITDPNMFFMAVRDVKGATDRLASILDSSMRQVVASFPFVALLSNERLEIMNTIKHLLESQTSTFGMEIVDVRIIRADLPSENSEAIFSRMRTEREKEAHEMRAKGFEESAVIMARADRDVKEMISEANRLAEIIRGIADSKATKIYAQAFALDREFFEFYRSLNSLEKSMPANNTSMVLTTKSEFFNKMNQKID